MKIYIKFLLALLLFSFASKSWAQSYFITNGTVNTCTGTFYDTGGSAGNYGNNQSFVYTICSDNAQPVYVNFKSFNLESGYDSLKIYDGPTNGGPLIGKYSGTTSPGLVITGGGTCLTFVFTSDASTSQTGWEAIIGCGVPPPPQSSVVFNSGTSTWTVPCGVTTATVECWGGGGGGGGDNNVSNTTPGGGGSGGYTSITIPVSPASTATYTVGVSGTAGVAGANGGNGGSSVFVYTPTTTTLTASGGQGGDGSSGANGGGGIGGMANGGSLNLIGSNGFLGAIGMSGAGATAPNGSIAGGPGGAGMPIDGNGINGGSPGGGGGGANHTGSTVNAGGSGGNGQIIIRFDNPSPIILGQLLSPQTLCQNQTATPLSVAAGGFSLSFQWYSNNIPTNAGGTLIGGATGPSYSPSTITSGTTYYYCVVSGPCGASVTSVVSGAVVVNSAPVANTGANQTICEGSGMSTFTITPSGGTPGYTYEWYDAITGGTLLTTSQMYSVGPFAGIYTYYGVVIDANSCVSPRTPVQLTVNPTPTMMSVNATDIDCFGNINGILNGNASGGTAPYEFSFDGNPPYYPNPITGLAAGSYSLYARDANGCAGSNWQANSINEPPPVSLSASSTGTNCFGGSNGTATIFAIGGVGGYNYSWSPFGGTASMATGLSAGTYTCNVVDANACPATYTVAITQPAALSVSPSGQTNVTCSGGADGTATVTAFGGTGGYSYSWSPTGGIAAAAFGLTIGNYTCTVTDALGCSAMQTFTINEPTPVTLTSNTQTNVSCFGAADGVVSVNPATGGSGFGYEYSLNGGSFFLGAINFTGLAAGNYTVVARDNNLCTSNPVTFTITEPSAITLGTAGNSTPCSGTALSVTLTGSGGAGSYTYSWIASADNPNTTGENFSTLSNTSLINNNITNLSAVAEVVNYSVNVTDVNGCIANFNVPTTILPAPTITPISNQVLCAGANNTAIVFTASIGGSTINWTNSNVSIGISGSGIGTITAVPMINPGITPVVANFIATPNFSGCNGPSQSFNITVNPLPIVTNAPTSSTCEGVALNIPLTSNIGGTTYTWISNNNPNTTGESISTMSTGLINNTINNITAVNQPLQYTVTPTVSGCVGAALTLTVTVFPQPNLIDPADQTLCAGFLTSAITFTSDVGGSTFTWTNSNASIGIPASGTTNIASATATNAGASPIVGNFSAQATANGCISTPQVFSITVNPIPTTPVPTASSVCLGSSTSFTTPFVAGGTYNWNFGDGNTSTLQNPNHTYVAAGAYTASVTVTAATCVSAVGTIIANVSPSTIGGTITGGTTPACNGSNSGTLTLVGNTGTVNGWEFSTNGGASWSPIVNTTNSQVYSNLTVTTMYRAIVQSGVCASLNSAIRLITVNDPPSAANAGIDQSLCNQTTATLSANAPGVGTGSWSVISGTAVVTTPASPSSGVTGLTIGASSVLRWTIANSPCTSTTDDITITSNPNPTIGGSLTSYTAGTSLLTGTGTTLSWSSSNTLVATINATSGLVSPLIPGTTNITYTNTDGCTAVATFTATLTPPTPTLTSNAPICEGDNLNLGTLDVGTYSWSGPNGFTSSLQNPTINSITAAGAGTYSLSITTGVCLSGVGTINVVVNPLPSGTVSPIDATCSGFANGSASVIPSGTGPFLYSYNGSAFVGTATQTGLSTGNYTVNVQSGAGCISSDILYFINEPTAITGSLVTSSNPSCSGSSDGSATINATGGNGIYNYSVDGGAYSPSNPILGLMAGPHLVNIQDGNGCFSAASVNFSLTDPLPLTVSNVTTDVSCFGGSNGTITATGSGGAGGYQYSIDNITFQGSTIFNSLSAGSYTVYITDASGCTSGNTTFISQPASNFLITTLGIDYVCDGEALAETFTSSGGFGSITYSWAAQPNPNGATSGSGNTISETLTTITTDPNVPETVIYDLSAIDQNGCSASSTFTAYVHPLPPVNITSNVNPLCVSSVANLICNQHVIFWLEPNSWFNSNQ
ncbi:MAG: hypothetical protein IPG89_10010 [Bacteroidetes bacterium]|nr:hypothetical protein [Bacteroidota bacterium]